MTDKLASTDYSQYLGGLAEYVINATPHEDGRYNFRLMIPKTSFINFDADKTFINQHFSSWSVMVEPPIHDELFGYKEAEYIEVELTTRYPLHAYY